MDKKIYFLGCLAVVLVTFAVYLEAVPQNGDRTQPPPVTDVCLGCICNAISNCNLTLTCNGETCGLFGITWAYWADSGKPTINGQPPDSTDAYSNCAVNPRCAAQSVQGYMSRFATDCNNDGKVDCYDHMAIHKLGGYGCQGYLPPDYVRRFNDCIRAVQARRQQQQQQQPQQQQG